MGELDLAVLAVSKMSLGEDKFSLNWREAQKSIADYLSKNNFLVWEERKLGNKRVDILAKRELNNKIFYIIFEVKHYNNVTSSAEEKFRVQLEDYLKLLIQRELKRKSKKQIFENYVFVGYLVLSKDYGICLNRKKNWRKKTLVEEDKNMELIWKRNVYLFCSSQEYIQSNLETVGLRFYSQSKLQDFFKKYQ